MRVANLGGGSGDGIPGALSGKEADVFIRGTRCPVLGRVTMDQIVVDVSHLTEDPATGKEAILTGRQGDEEIRTSETAEKAETIPWEILTGITSRAERIYRRSRCFRIPVPWIPGTRANPARLLPAIPQQGSFLTENPPSPKGKHHARLHW